MHSSDQSGIAAVSTTNTFSLLTMQHSGKCFSAQQRRVCGHSRRESWLTRIHLQCADCAKREWEWQVAVTNASLQRYPVSQSGVIISWLMVKRCSSCQEHRENGCLVSTMFWQDSNDVMRDKITKEDFGTWKSAEEWRLLSSVNTLRLSHA